MVGKSPVAVLSTLIKETGYHRPKNLDAVGLNKVLKVTVTAVTFILQFAVARSRNSIRKNLAESMLLHI